MLISSLDAQLNSAQPGFSLAQVALIQQSVRTALLDYAPFQQAIAQIRSELATLAAAVSDSLEAPLETLQQSVMWATLKAIDPTLELPATPIVTAAVPAEPESTVPAPLAEPGDVFQQWLEGLSPIAAPVESSPVDPMTAGAKPGGRVDTAGQSSSTGHWWPTATWLARSPSPADLAAQREAAWVARVHEIMTHLRQTREQQGISLAELHQRTHITIHQLQILEGMNLDEFPEEIYIRGFIRRIGQALGLNGIQLAQSLPSLGASTTSRSRSAMMTTKPAVGGGLIAPSALPPVHLYLAYGVLMGGAATGLNLLLQQAPTTAELPPLEPTVTTPSDRTDPSTHVDHLDGRGLSSFQEIAPPDVIPEFHR